MHTFETLEFYRGFSNRWPIDRPSVITTRKDRRPRNFDDGFHARADAWFEKKFGIRYRSQAVFITSAHFTARGYGATPDHVARIIPLGEYKFCWSPKRIDLLFFERNNEGLDIEQYLDESQYQDSDLELAHSTKHEVMLYCEQYISIPTSLMKPPETAPLNGAPLIYLGS